MYTAGRRVPFPISAYKKVITLWSAPAKNWSPARTMVRTLVQRCRVSTLADEGATTRRKASGSRSQVVGTTAGHTDSHLSETWSNVPRALWSAADSTTSSFPAGSLWGTGSAYVETLDRVVSARALCCSRGEAGCTSTVPWIASQLGLGAKYFNVVGVVYIGWAGWIPLAALQVVSVQEVMGLAFAPYLF
jgi:hypothetical protein